MDYLLFRIYGSLASWGEIAVGEVRRTAIYPRKSALLGLLAAALGIRRDEEERHRVLSVGYQFAVKVISPGVLLRDYHTTQVPDSVGKFVYRSRRDELVVGKSRLGTILSSREYRCDALFLVATRALSGAPYSLEHIRAALLEPKFHLYLGRKCCPPAAPLNPLIRSADGFGQALDEYPVGPISIPDTLIGTAKNECDNEDLSQAPSLRHLSNIDRFALASEMKTVIYYWEGDAGDLHPQQRLIRHDQPLSRSRWQFTRREENMYLGKE